MTIVIVRNRAQNNASEDPTIRREGRTWRRTSVTLSVGLVEETTTSEDSQDLFVDDCKSCALEGPVGFVWVSPVVFGY